MMEIGKMASKKLYIVESLLGGKNIYDESGKLVGYSYCCGQNIRWFHFLH